MKIIFYSLFILSLIIISCKEDEPNAPEDGTKSNEGLTEATIGAAGGILETEELKISIPQGAFSSSHDLRLTISEENKPYNNRAVSNLFKLDGLPPYSNKPIRITIKYNGELSQKAFIAFGEESLVKSVGSLETTYFLVEAKDSSGFLVCELEPYDQGNGKLNHLKKEKSLSNWLYIVGVDNIFDITTSQGHFKIHGDIAETSENELLQVGAICETAYQTFLNKGFSYDKKDKWPVPVFVMELNNAWGMYSGSRYSGNNGYILLNDNLFNQLEELSVTVGHEFLHLIQDLYDPRDWSIKVSDFGSRYWLDEATAIYCEEFFVDNSDTYISSTFHNYKFAPFNGFHKEGSGAGDHGYGMSSLIKYLTSQYSPASIVNFYEDILKSKHPIEALKNNTNGSTDWTAPFFRNYIEGKIYNVSAEAWINSVHGDNIFKVESRIDTIKKYPYSYPDLSGELFIVDLNYPNWKENTNMYFTILGGEDYNTEISVYRISDNKNLDYLSSDYSQVTVKNIEDMTSSGFDLVALITNSNANHPYANNTNINFQIDIKEPLDPIKNYKTAYIELHVKGFFIRSNSDTTYEDQYYEFYETYSPGGQNGNLNGTTFTSSWSDSREEDYPEDGTTVTWNGSINIIFSEDFKEIISYTETNSENWPGWRTSNMSVSVKNIPFYYGDDWSGDEYLLDTGEETCNNLVSRSENTTWWDGSSYVFSRNECDEGSYISVKLYEE